MFTEPVTGPSLADLLLQTPEAAAGLLCGTFTELRLLHPPPTARLLGPAGVIGERSIVGTFQRKFNGISGRTYLDLLGAERCAGEQRQEVAGVLRQVAARLRRLWGSLVPQGRQVVLAYGDLKPEHVAFLHGLGGRPVFIDPGLLLAGTAVDAAKLISRTVLLLAAARPGADAAQQTAAGVDCYLLMRCWVGAPTLRAGRALTRPTSRTIARGSPARRWHRRAAAVLTAVAEGAGCVSAARRAGRMGAGAEPAGPCRSGFRCQMPAGGQGQGMLM
ncbi:hypothetical protein ABZ553_04305 [Streptomyces sparsogenes]|uniref:hypothetical protein n=1 Tax=Streptomyces sparsogenes TaxID=67365 RepID=UPI0033FB9033